MTGGDQLARLRPWNALAVALLGLYVVGLVLFCYAALTTTPTRTDAAITRPPFSAYGEPRAWWPVALQMVLGAAAFAAYYRPRRHETRSFSLLITAGLGLSTLVLGVGGVWNCTPAESPFFAPLGVALGLLLGNAPSFTGVCEALPLAVQVARIFGPLLVVFTAYRIAVAVFRSQLDRLVVRFARSLVVVVGLGAEAIPLVRRLAHDLPRQTKLAVFVADGKRPPLELAPKSRVRVVVSDLENQNAIRVLVLRQGRFKVQALYVVSADVSANLAWARQFRNLADASEPRNTDPPPRITARIDDPWQAEYWRRTNAYRTPAGDRPRSVRWVSDALSSYEVTAAVLVGHVQSQPHDRLVVVGHSPLALAICAELAQRHREGKVLHVRPTPSFAELVLVGPAAGELRRQHQIRQERFGNSAEISATAVEPVLPTEPALAALLAGCSAPAVIFADHRVGTGDDLSATLLAAQHPDWTIYHPDAETQGLVPRPIMERLYPYGLTIEPPEGAALDSWERAARVVHQSYLDSLTDRDETKPAQRPWAELDPFYRASNVRLVTATLAAAESVGRSWGPPAGGVAELATTAVPPDQLEQMAELEHESWRRFYTEHGWRYGPARDDARQVHDALVPWSQLGIGLSAASGADRHRRARHPARPRLPILDGQRPAVADDDPPGRGAGDGAAAALAMADPRRRLAAGAARRLPGPQRHRGGVVGRAGDLRPDVRARRRGPVAPDRGGRRPAGPAGRAGAHPGGTGHRRRRRLGDQRAAGEQRLTSADHVAESYEPVGA